MTDQTDTPEASAESRAVTVVKERMVAHSPVAIWDTADMEQMQRVAVVLVRSGLVPQTLSHGKWMEDGKEVEGYLGDATVAARCTLVCNQARLWQADPLNVLQCTSLINGRLMYEGKLIAAVVASMTGVKLRYKFGVWNKDHIEFPEDETALHGAGEALAIRCYDPDDEARFVDGSVGQWKTTRSGNPWSLSANWPRQLRYRASREWARAYEPGVILGILADGDQEVEEFVQEIRGRASGVMQRLSGKQEGAGFDAENVQAQTPKRTRKAKEEPGEPEEAMHAAGEAEDDVTPGKDASNEEAKSDEAPHAPPGAIYMLKGDSYNRDNRRPIYKDGKWYSTVTKKNAGRHIEYERHAPEVTAPAADAPEEVQEGCAAPGEVYFHPDFPPVEGDRRVAFMDGERCDVGDMDTSEVLTYAEHSPLVEAEMEERPTETAGAQPAEPEPDTSETATPASDAGAPPEEDSGLSAPADDDLSDLPDDFKAFIETVQGAREYREIPAALKFFYNTETFGQMDDKARNKVRADTWSVCVERAEAGELTGLPDHADDISAFRLWLETVTDKDAIDGTLAVLQRGEQWGRVTETSHNIILDAVAERKKVI